MGGIFKPKGGKTQKTTQEQSTSYPQWSQDALRDLVDTSNRLNSPFMTPPERGIADMNNDQKMAFGYARNLGQQAFLAPPIGVRGDPTARAAQVGSAPDATAAQVGRAEMMQAAQIGPMAQAGLTNASSASARAARVDPNSIQGMMNPYLNAVMNPALRQAERSRNENQSAIGARAAASGSFGGSREALQRGQADRAYQESTSGMVAELMAKGWDAASALSQANAQMEQQTNLSNAQMEQQTNLTNAGAANDLARFNTGAINEGRMAQAGYNQQANQINQSTNLQRLLAQAGYDQQTGQANQAANIQRLLAQAGYDQQTGMRNADLPLELAKLNSGLADADQGRRLNALQSLLGIGNQQQAYQQSLLDLPFAALARHASLVPQQLNSTQTGTSTAPNKNASPFQNAVGAASAILPFFSDKDAKTNIELLGRDPDTGLKNYAYDYKADVQAAKSSGQPMPPKRVGPMAQEVKKAGGATKKIGGNLAILMGK